VTAIGGHARSTPSRRRNVDAEPAVCYALVYAIAARSTADVPLDHRELEVRRKVERRFELEIRLAMKPRTTIIIAESEFEIPFDASDIAARRERARSALQPRAARARR
jgi:hypothetical protein